MINEIRTHCNDEELVKERRDHILRSSTKLLCKQGYHRTNVREIAKACDMSIGNLYHYVGTKEDILTLILERAVSEPAKAADKMISTLTEMSPAKALREHLKMYIKMIDYIGDITVFVYQEAKNLTPEGRRTLFDSEAQTQRALETLLKRGIEAGEFDIGNVSLTAQNIIIIAEAWAFRRWQFQKIYNLDQYIEEQTEFILRSIKSGNKQLPGSKSKINK